MPAATLAAPAATRRAPAHREHQTIVITEETVIEAHDLALKKEQNDEWYVGREDLGSFIALPELWAQAVIFMSLKSPLTGKYPTFAAVKHFVRTKTRDDEEFHEEIDRELRILLAQLTRHRIIRAIGPVVLEEQQVVRDLLPSISVPLARMLTGRAALAILSVLTASAGVLLLLLPELRPALAHYYWLPYPGLNLLVTVASATVFTFLHELGHLVAARAARLRTTLSLEVRGGVLPTFVANVFDLLKASRPAQLRVYAAGILIDFFVAALTIWLLFLTTSGIVPWPPVAVGFLQQLLLLRLLSVTVQLFFGLRTDITNMLGIALGDREIHTRAHSYLSEVRTRIAHPVHRGRPVHYHERSWPAASPNVRRYARWMLASFIAYGIFFVVTFARLWYGLAERAWDGLFRPALPGSRIDSLLFFGLVWLVVRFTLRARTKSRTPAH